MLIVTIVLAVAALNGSGSLVVNGLDYIMMIAFSVSLFVLIGMAINSFVL